MIKILLRQFLGKPKQSLECNATLEHMIQFVHDDKRNTPHAPRDLSK